MIKSNFLTTTAFVAAASISAPAISDVSVSGYQEWNYIDRGKESDGGLGVLTGLTFKGGGELDNGIGYSVSFTVEDNGANAISSFNAAGRAITFSLGEGLSLGIGYDQSYGIETVKAISPYVNNRRADILGAHRGLLTATNKPHGPDVWDTSSGENAIGLGYKNDMVSLSLGFTPKRDQVRSTDSSGTASDQGSATSFGIKINAVEGLTIAGGATSENSDTVTNSDPKGSTIGFSYKLGNFAIGYQEIENDIDAADSTPDSTEIEEGGIAYKVNDALTIGVYGASIAYIQDSANDNGVETDLAIVQIGYNLGPAVVQYDYVEGNHLNGDVTDTEDTHKLKVKVNF